MMNRFSKAYNKRKTEYYKRVRMAYKYIGIKQPPENMGLIGKLRYIYKQLK